MSTLTLERLAHQDTLQFRGEIDLGSVALHLNAYQRWVVSVAELPSATNGDRLRALAAMFDAEEERPVPNRRYPDRIDLAELAKFFETAPDSVESAGRARHS